MKKKVIIKNSDGGVENERRKVDQISTYFHPWAKKSLRIHYMPGMDSRI